MDDLTKSVLDYVKREYLEEDDDREGAEAGYKLRRGFLGHGFLGGVLKRVDILHPGNLCIYLTG